MDIIAHPDSSVDPLSRDTCATLAAVRHVAVVVPANNEAGTIANTIRSVNVARSRLPDTVTSSLTIVADNCDDATSTSAVALIDPTCDRVIACRLGNVGAARALGTAHAISSARVPPSETWLANTDADTVVAPDWLLRQVAHARCGRVGVAGVVHLDAARFPSAALVARFTSGYRIDADGTHLHVHGANLGVAAKAYLEVGGWRSLTTGEDHDLWHRVRRAGPVVTDGAITVATDPRLSGRAPEGFAADIDDLARAIA